MLKSLNCVTLWLILIPTILEVAHSLEYSDLQMLGVSCLPRDTCTYPVGRNFLSTNCECDPKCYQYNDCCINAPLADSRTMDLKPGMTCMAYGSSYQGVYAINKCPSNWSGSMEVRQKCENLDDISDPLVAAHATDIKNDITYRNRYCSECNNADVSQLQSWVIGIVCDSLAEANATYRNISEQYIVSHLSYKDAPPNKNRWGVYYRKNASLKEIFYPCVLDFHLSEYLKSHVRFCRPNLISTCAKNWVRNTVRRHCEAYMAVVYFNDFTYRNPHCALCNNLPLGNLSCVPGLISRKKSSLSFSLLLDINKNDGDRVGLKADGTECPNDQTWDPFAKTCRSLVCPFREQVLVNGKCVRK